MAEKDEVGYNPSMKHLVFLSGIILGTSVFAQNLPTQKVLIDNEYVRVLDIHYAPGMQESVHSHQRGVTIAMSDYDNETKTVPGGKVNKGHTKFGRVAWNEPVTHEAHNTGTTEQHVVRIEIKKDPPAAALVSHDPLDSLIACKDTEKLLFENAYVRAIEVHSAAGNAEPQHSHGRGVTVAMSDYDSEATTFPDGKVTHNHANKGDVRWTTPVVHSVKNVGTTEQYVVRIDIK